MIAKILLLLALVGTVLGREVSDSEVVAEFGKFVQEYRMTYDSLEEKIKRYSIFANNYRRIVEFNSRDEDVKLGVNQFADMTEEEFRSRPGLSMPSDIDLRCKEKHHKGEVREVLDWREKNVVTSVKNQGGCGSCWAFSAIGALEGLHAIKKGSLVEYSEQELVDCTLNKQYFNFGCHGGMSDRAFKYIADSGISTESEYGYEGDDLTCRKVSRPFKISGCVQVSPGDSQQLLEALNIGPVSVFISSGSFKFMFYSSGIIQRACDHKMDHVVLRH